MTEQTTAGVAKLMIIGVGGGGGNAVNSMIDADIDQSKVRMVAVNTDMQALQSNKAEHVVIGKKLTRGLGAGADPEIGRRAAEENSEDIQKLLEGTDLVFIAAGMGGGTGSGAAPVIAKIAKDMGILTIAVVTKPFDFEGYQRMDNANRGINSLKGNVDSLVIVQNEKLNATQKFKLTEAFLKADEILLQGIKGVADIIVKNGRINLDLADVKRVMADSGMAHMGIGDSRKAPNNEKVKEEVDYNNAIIAIHLAVYSPLLETTIESASNVIINFVVGEDVLLDDINKSLRLIRKVVKPDANIIFGVCIEPEMKEHVQATVIATGFGLDGSTSFLGQNNNDNNTVYAQPKETQVEQPVQHTTTSVSPRVYDASGSVSISEDKNVPPFVRKMRK